jgi:hypothetical protein
LRLGAASDALALEGKRGILQAGRPMTLDAALKFSVAPTIDWVETQ